MACIRKREPMRDVNAGRLHRSAQRRSKQETACHYRQPMSFG
jgi:hypothetical protein